MEGISYELVEAFLEFLPEGSIILELGTGPGTQKLSKHFKVISIENKPRYHTGHSELVHIPRKNLEIPSEAFWKRFPLAEAWYHPAKLKRAIEKRRYDAILVDGPKSSRSRIPMWYYYSRVFNIKVPVIVDDVQREYDWKLAFEIARVKNRVKKVDKMEVRGFGNRTQFAIIK